MDMNANCLPQHPHSFSMQGTCPHCLLKATFLMKTPAHIESIPLGAEVRLWAVLQCQGCLNFICGAVQKRISNSDTADSSRYFTHYPIGKPDQRVATEIPDAIANDFKRGDEMSLG